MKTASQYKLLLFVLSGILAVAVGLFGTVLLQTWREYRSMKTREETYRLELTVAREEIRRKEAYFNRLMTDPEFFERIVRQRLGYSREDEVVFRFEK